jgi:ssDNA-binding Zn-finger/Zn-ribbon topoisomerase 1
MTISYGKLLDHPCPDCGRAMALRRSRYGPFYGCTGYPLCEASHGAHKATGKPLGVPANAETKRARERAHAAFDPLWKSGGMKRREAYAWLATELDIPEAHMGEMDVAMCARVVEACEAHTAARGDA